MSDESVATKQCPRCAETIKEAALVCHFCNQEFDVERVGYCTACHQQVTVTDTDACPTCGSATTDIIVRSTPRGSTVPAPPTGGSPTAVPPPPPPPPPGPVAAPAPGGREGRRAGRRPGILVRLLAALGILALVFVGITVYFATRPAADDPMELVDQFEEVGIVCRDLDEIFDDRESKAVGCASQDSHIITVTTYGSAPSAADWVEDTCAVRDANSIPNGYYVIGDEFVIDIRQGAYPTDALGEPRSTADAAGALAEQLDGEAAAYDCRTAG